MTASAGCRAASVRHLHHRGGTSTATPLLTTAVRSPQYLTLTVAWAVVGVFRILGRIIRWWHATDLYSLEHQAAADGLLNEHLRIHKQGRETRTARGIILAICLRGVGCRRPAWRSTRRAWAWILLGPGRGPRPRPARQAARQGDRAARGPPCRGAATVAGRHHPRTRRAGHRRDRPVAPRRPRAGVPSPSARGRPRLARRGRPAVRRHDVDGDRTAGAARLRSPAAARRGVARAGHRTSTRDGSSCGSAVPTSPRPARRRGRCCRSGTCDIFQPVPFGTDVRGRSVRVPLIYHNWLIGSHPAAGQDQRGPGPRVRGRARPAVRAVDPRAQGIRRPRPARAGRHRFVSGIHDDAIGYAAESLRLLRAEIGRRAERLQGAAAGGVPGQAGDPRDRSTGGR